MAAAAGRKPEQHKKKNPGGMPRVCFFYVPVEKRGKKEKPSRKCEKNAKTT